MSCCARPGWEKERWDGSDEPASALQLLAREELGKAPVNENGPRNIRVENLMSPRLDKAPMSPTSARILAEATSCMGGSKSSSDGPCAFAFSPRTTMILSLGVFLYEGLVYNVIFLGRILPAVGKEAFILPFLLIFNGAWGLAVWSYARAHSADPGRVPRQWQEFVSCVADALPVVPARLEWQAGKATLCRKCGTPRPERAHHCHLCGVCILRMDHHCPWINNCVGFFNQKYFILLITYTALATLLAILTTIPEVVLCVRQLLHLEGKHHRSAAGSRHQAEISICDIIAFFIYDLLALIFLVLLSPMLATHIPLAAHNMSSIESHYDNGVVTNPFDQGSTLSNMAEVFGAFGWDWFLPIEPLRPLSDGISFSRRGEHEDALALQEAIFLQQIAHKASDREELWRVRYEVPPPQPVELPLPPEYGPIASLTRWWSTDGGLLRCTRSPAV